MYRWYSGGKILVSFVVVGGGESRGTGYGGYSDDCNGHNSVLGSQFGVSCGTTRVRQAKVNKARAEKRAYLRERNRRVMFAVVDGLSGPPLCVGRRE